MRTIPIMRTVTKKNKGQVAVYNNIFYFNCRKRPGLVPVSARATFCSRMGCLYDQADMHNQRCLPACAGGLLT